ncbi:MAG: hypothetical protein LC753_04730 [Acidobacteria bacterium]|nr:hypothetical protein [Acidobacteriota bacterium]
MTPWPSSRTLVLAAAIALFVACCLLPIGYLLTIPLTSMNVASSALWLDARQQGLLRNTALLGVG